MGKISNKKLYAPLSRFDILKNQYVQEAKVLAKDILEGTEPNVNALAKIRLAAIVDKKHLKGDCVISVFLQALSEQNEFSHWRGGKRIKISEKMIRKIYHHHFTKEVTVKVFCTENRLTKSKYYRVVNCNVKLPSDKEYLEKLKATVYFELHPQKLDHLVKVELES